MISDDRIDKYERFGSVFVFFCNCVERNCVGKYMQFVDFESNRIERLYWGTEAAREWLVIREAYKLFEKSTH